MIEEEPITKHKENSKSTRELKIKKKPKKQDIEDEDQNDYEDA